MEKFIVWFFGILLGILIFISLAFFKAILVMLLWNWLLVSVWHLPLHLTFWQSFGLTILLGLLIPTSVKWEK